MKKQRNNKTRIVIALTITLITLIMSGLFVIGGIPTGPVMNYVSNSTSSTAGNGVLRNEDDGGYLTTINLDVLQQDLGWKAYVGNVTGKLTLDDANNATIYDWTLSSIDSNVYISRSQDITWTSVGCAARSVIETEDTALGKPSDGDENINNTFIGTTHKALHVAGTSIGASQCPAIATYVSDAAQSNGESNLFQEILLDDSSGRLIYTTIAETGGEVGFNDQTYDFQVIVPDDETGGVITPYYFFVEITG